MKRFRLSPKRPAQLSLIPGQQDAGERGSVIVEFALVVGGLLVGLLLFVDVAGSLGNYLRISQAVAEGIKIGSRMQGIDANNFVDLDMSTVIVADCLAGTGPTGQCSHLRVHQRVRYLLNNLLNNVPANTVSIRTELINDPLAPPPTNVFRVNVSGQYRGVWILNIPMNSSGEGPYLVQ